MSATGRGPRLGGPDDVYETPAWCVRRLLDVWKPPYGKFVEPAAGSGAIINVINSVYRDAQWTAYESRATQQRALELIGADTVIADFLTVDVLSDKKVALVITNPPFKLAAEFIAHSRRLFPNSEIMMLLRLPFLEGQVRRALFRDVGMPDVFVLPNRPSFIGGTTDNTAYGWFRWYPEYATAGRTQSVLQILRDTPPEERATVGRGRPKRKRQEASTSP